VRCVVPDIVNPPWIFGLTVKSFVIPSAAYSPDPCRSLPSAG
jgi:hypothetical protein